MIAEAKDDLRLHHDEIERIAQLVREHRQELVLQRARALELLVRGALSR